jgi:type IV pilus assembly protein PilE
MIVVAIIGVIAMIAYPTFTEHVKKARRTDAKAALVELAQLQENRLAKQGGYAESLDDSDLLGGADRFGFKRESENQYLSKDGNYRLLINNTSEDRQSFTLQAFAIAGQATDEHCARFEISSTGKREAFDSSNQLQNDCW